MERLPSKSIRASEAKTSSNRVRLYGTLVSLDFSRGSLTLDDGSSSVGVLLNNPELKQILRSYKPGDQIMLTGWVSPKGVEVEVVRKITGFEPDRYKQILEVTRDVSSKNE